MSPPACQSAATSTFVLVRTRDYHFFREMGPQVSSETVTQVCPSKGGHWSLIYLHLFTLLSRLWNSPLFGTSWLGLMHLRRYQVLLHSIVHTTHSSRIMGEKICADLDGCIKVERLISLIIWQAVQVNGWLTCPEADLRSQYARSR
jgi:hypothetical protein